jgi:putative endonuclease
VARVQVVDFRETGDNWPPSGIDRCAVDIGVGALPQGGGMTMLTRAEIGVLGERLAAEHLTGLGLQILTRNWRCRYGELDVIAVDPVTDTVVFVEVKARTGDGFGGLAQAVTPQKARRLRRLAAIWLAAQDRRWAAVRIDVIGVRIGRRRTPEITHLQGVG